MKRKPEDIRADIDRIRHNLQKFDIAVLKELQRIDRFEVWEGSSGGGPKPKNAVSDPTGNRVAMRMDGRLERDPVGKAVKQIDTAIFNMARQTETLLAQLTFILDPKARKEPEAKTAYCQACGRVVEATRADRLRSGYCTRDYTRWIREGRPSRTQFELAIRAEEYKVE